VSVGGSAVSRGGDSVHRGTAVDPGNAHVGEGQASPTRCDRGSSDDGAEGVPSAGGSRTYSLLAECRCRGRFVAIERENC